VLIAAMKLVEPELGAKTEHVGHGFVKLPEGKMSSRTGNIITGEWLVDEVKRKVLEVMKDGVLRQVQDKLSLMGSFPNFHGAEIVEIFQIMSLREGVIDDEAIFFSQM